jgi:hypothetical protein
MQGATVKSNILRTPASQSPFELSAGPRRNKAAAYDGSTEVRQHCVGVVIGTIVDLTSLGEPLVDHPYNTSGKPLRAQSIVSLTREERGRQGVLMFEEANVNRPVILGLLATGNPTSGAISIEVEDEKRVFTAKREIILRCGGASITLTRAGRILIQGEYVLTRSKGVNRIKGASVQIN